MNEFVWHEPSEIPAAPTVVKTNLMNYHIGYYSDGRWWLRNGRRFTEAEKLLGAKESISAWAYIGGEIKD